MTAPFPFARWHKQPGCCGKLASSALFGIDVSEPLLDYPRLLARAGEVVRHIRDHSIRREQVERVGVTIHEKSGTAHFVDAHTVETESGLRLQADKIILSAGGTSRRPPIPGFEWTGTHSDAWALTAVPPSMIVVGAGATGVQVASIFQVFGTQVQLFQAGPRILPTEDEDVCAAVAAAFRESGMVVHENFGTIESFEKTPEGRADGLLQGWRPRQCRGFARDHGGWLGG